MEAKLRSRASEMRDEGLCRWSREQRALMRGQSWPLSKLLCREKLVFLYMLPPWSFLAVENGLRHNLRNDEKGSVLGEGDEVGP